MREYFKLYLYPTWDRDKLGKGFKAIYRMLGVSFLLAPCLEFLLISSISLYGMNFLTLPRVCRNLTISYLFYWFSLWSY